MSNKGLGNMLLLGSRLRGPGLGSCLFSGLDERFAVKELEWVVVKMMVPFWVPILIRHPII